MMTIKDKTTCFLARLPEDCSNEIVSYFSAEDLGKCCRVSSLWNKVLSNESHWEHLFPNFLKQEHQSKLPIKQIIGSYPCVAKSETELVQLIKKFTDKTSYDQLKEFTCFGPFNKNAIITVKLNLSKEPLRYFEPSTLVQERKTCFFTGKLKKFPENSYTKGSYKLLTDICPVMLAESSVIMKFPGITKEDANKLDDSILANIESRVSTYHSNFKFKLIASTCCAVFAYISFLVATARFSEHSDLREKITSLPPYQQTIVIVVSCLVISEIIRGIATTPIYKLEALYLAFCRRVVDNLAPGC